MGKAKCPFGASLPAPPKPTSFESMTNRSRYAPLSIVTNFWCTGCEERFVDLASWDTHWNSVHEVPSADAKYCAVCEIFHHISTEEHSSFDYHNGCWRAVYLFPDC